MCGRSFGRDDGTNDEVRVYTASRATTVEVDDLIGVSTVTVSGAEWTEGVDWAAWPLNAPAKGRPWTELRALAAGFPVGTIGAVEITGRFGWPQPPWPIVQAAGILAVKLARRQREAPFGIVTAGIDQGATARIARNDPDVVTLVQPYTRGVLLA
jgi:hypothetical protein